MFTRLYQWWQDRQRLKAIHNERFIWRCYRVGGGGEFSTPELSRDKAIQYLKKSGGQSLLYVDDENKMLFYR